MPLNFLGSVYNAIVMAFIDLANLSELLAENPDVSDARDATPLPSTNEDEPDIAVEFDNVTFHYPSQSDSQGLKGLSFKLKRGTTTAVVGSTGAGEHAMQHCFCTDLHLIYLSRNVISDTNKLLSLYVIFVLVGKTTVSRLLFRFYDCLGGAVKVNGRDVRTITQRSLRDAIGVVPVSSNDVLFI